MNDLEYTLLKSKILRLTRIDLDNYKSVQMRRRLEGFIDRTKGLDVSVYCKHLDRDPKMLQDLRDFLTINVSEFFRDADPFEVLQTQILPGLLKRSPKLNIWSAGCSIGAEPYSLVMMLRKISPGSKHRILATDIDEKALAKAAAGGPYSASEVKGVPPEFAHKHLVADGGRFRIVDNIRHRVEFRQHDLLTGPPDLGFDLILCRNVIIYFTDKAKDNLHSGFAKALKDQGVLFLGGTEALLSFEELGLKRIHTSFYQKTGRDAVQDQPRMAPQSAVGSTKVLSKV